jgi:hypothetical protein
VDYEYCTRPLIFMDPKPVLDHISIMIGLVTGLAMAGIGAVIARVKWA